MSRYMAVLILSGFFFISCTSKPDYRISSPNNNISVFFELTDGLPFYKVVYGKKSVIKKSELGFSIKDKNNFSNNFEIIDTKTNSFDETWEQVWGEKQYIRNQYNELTISIQEKSALKRKIDIIFRAFDDGIAFRYSIPSQENIDSLIIMDEKTEFILNDNHSAWWIPAYEDNRYEYLYKKSDINELNVVHTPLTIETKDSLFLAIHEADLTDYASMTLRKTGENILKCDLVPWMDGTRVKLKSPAKSPWRTIQIAEKPGDLITSYMILNLNEPNKLDDLSYIKPCKYMGIWWGMHIGKYTFWESEKQGATTKNAKMYIDFAAKNNINYLLIEGWNKGWTPAWYENAMHQFSFTDCADGFDIIEVNNYAQKNNVELIGYHETGSNLKNYQSQIDTGFALYNSLGIHNIKIGQVGSRLNMKEWHHGQYGVRYYREVLQKAAKYKMAVNFHEPIKATGERRTYPNMMMREGARGQEYNAWSDGNPPEHTVILPFTRLLGGPLDFTPGIVDINIKERSGRKVHTTIAKQLALYLTIYSPVQMMADLPENYEGHPAFNFLLDIPTDWNDTKVLNAKIGDYLTIARKDKNSENWYLGSTSDQEARSLDVTLDFLDDNIKYKAEIYADGENCEYDKNPLPLSISEIEVAKNSVLKINLARGGGQAIKFSPINNL